MTLRISDRRRKRPDPVEEDGRRRLQAEGRWIVQGPVDEVSAVHAALGRISTAITPEVLELDFGNAVGWYDAGPLGRLQVVSGKWSDEHYDAMLERITEEVASLPFAAGTTSAIPYDRTALGAEDVLYHAFAYLRHIVGTPDRPRTDLTGPLRSLLARPHRRTTRRGQVVPVGQARRVDTHVLIDMASGRWPLRPAPHIALARHMRGLAPEEIEESVLDHNLDTAENRFVKSFLSFCMGVVHRMRRATDEQSPVGRRIRSECDYIEGTLHPLVHHGLWNEVGRMVHFPASSTVLQRRPDYRSVFTHFGKLRLGSRIPLTPTEARALLEVKDIASLYELWSCFALIRAVRRTLGDPAEVLRTETSDLQTSVVYTLQARWHDGTAVHYNPSFSRSGSDPWHSYSVPLRPDLVLEIPSGDNAGQHIFDAKFKLERLGALVPPTDDDGADPVNVEEQERRGRFTRGDLYKMHTYRDALSARSAWVLYPGTEFNFYPADADRSPVAEVAQVGVGIDGVGGIPLPTDSPGDALVDLVGKLVTRRGALRLVQSGR